MPFPSALAAGDYTNLRAGFYSAVQRASVCPNTVVFAAQVNQAVFDPSFAEVTFDNVTTGAIADAKEGFTVYIGSSATPANNATFIGRVREEEAGAVLSINESSAALADDMYITVTKDIRAQPKLQRLVAGVWKMDYEIGFRELLPTISGIPTAIVIVMDGAGNADYAFDPTGHYNTSGSAASSWAWDSDTAAYIVGNAASRNPTLRWTVAGHYMPRVTVTDDGAREGWFSPHVFVVPADKSSQIITGFAGANITRDVNNGATATIEGWTGISDILHSTFVVLWRTESYNGTTTPIETNIDFCGRFRSEDDFTTGDDRYSTLTKANFVLEGIGTQLASLPVTRIATETDDTPTLFGEINNLTLWRATVFLLTEFTNLANVSGIAFGITDETYERPLVGTQQPHALGAANNIMGSINAALCFCPEGEIEIRRNANYLSDADRNALTTVANWTTADVYDFHIEIGHMPQFNRMTAWGGAYDTTTEKDTIFQAITPAVAPGRGGEGGFLNAQVLESDAILADIHTEMALRDASEFAARNPKPHLPGSHPGGYHFIVPTNWQWYTFTIAATDNVRGLVYTTDTRWLLRSVSISHSNITGIREVSPTYTQETQGTGAQIAVQIAPTEIPPTMPVLPPLPVFPGFPPMPGIGLPNPNPADDEIPPEDPGDVQPVVDPDPPTDPDEVPGASTGNTVMWHNASQVFLSMNFGLAASPTSYEVTPSGVHTIYDADFSPTSAAAYILANSVGGGLSELITFSDATAYTFILRPGRPNDNLAILDATFGNPLPSGKSNGYGTSPAANDSATVCIKVEFDTDQTIAGGSLDYYYTATAQADTTRGMYLYDSGDVLLDSSVVTTSVTRSVWHNQAFTFSPAVANVAYVVFYYARDDTPPGNAVLWMDNCRMFGEGNVAVWRTADIVTPTPTWIEGEAIAVTGTQPRLGVGNADVLYAYDPDSADSYYSVDGGVNMAVAVSAGATPGNTAGCGAYNTVVYVGIDAQCAEATAGGAYANDEPFAGTYPLAIEVYSALAYYAGAAAAIAGETVFKVINGAGSAITPHDGGNDGLVVGTRSIATTPNNTSLIAGVFNFGGTVKAAYSSDAGANWAMATTAVAAGALAVAFNGTLQVYISNDSNAILYSIDGGDNFVSKLVPGTSIVNVKVR